MRARFAGVCAVTGRRYTAGTEITKTASGKWAIAAGATAYEPIEHIKLEETATSKATDCRVQLSKLVCSCCRQEPGFDRDKPETYNHCRFARVGDALTCKNCGRKGTVVHDPKPPAETRQCWECGRSFTYADCKRGGGDWGDNYCGC